jgi:hypothetical protein
LLLGSVASGCNATCIRDSDCLGASMCTDNRCILIARRDAGPISSSPGDTDEGLPSEPDASSERDAGD